MKVRTVKPVGEHMVPFPTAPYAFIPKEGVRVEFPGRDGYWARRQMEGVITVEDGIPAEVIIEAVKAKKKEAE